MLVNRIVFIFDSPGKNYTCITLSRRKMKETVFISGWGISFRFFPVFVSFLHQTALAVNCLRRLLGFTFRHHFGITS